MFNYPNNQSIRTISHIPLFSRRGIHTILARYLLSSFLLCILLLMGCAIVRQPSLKKSFGPHDAEAITTEIRNQADKVSSFYTSGTVLIKDWKWESEADILIAGIRDPFKIKIEITHPWGKPILHILIANDRLDILSFNEKRLYSGHFTSDALSRFLPGRFFDRSLIWAVLRGYPYLMEHKRIETPEMNTIKLSDQKGNVVEIIEIDPESLLPEHVFFPYFDLSLTFSGFMNDNGIHYAAETKMNSVHGGKNLVLKNRKIVFNRNIPEPIFSLEKMSGFETVYLEEIHDMK